MSESIWRRDRFYSAAVYAPVSQIRHGCTRDFPALALARVEELSAIQDVLRTECERHRVPLPEQAFPRWLHDQDHSTGPDPVIPQTPYFAQLEKELREQGGSNEQIAAIVRAVTTQCEQALRMLQRVRERVTDQDADRSEVRIERGRHPGQAGLVDDWRVSYRGRSYTLHAAHVAKLEVLYRRQHKQSTVGFEAALFCVLARYTSLGDTGFQGALPESVFDVLSSELDVAMEGFASPLNCRYGLFCSAFPDTDADFGSVGSFFEFWPVQGSFEVNPPFTEAVSLRMAEHIDAVLTAAGDEHALSFVVIVPGWTDAAYWRCLRSSPHLQRFRAILSPHAYVVGDQHVAARRYLPATFATGVFVLQNRKAAARWTPTDERMRRLAAAFQDSLQPLDRDARARLDAQMRRKRERDRQAGRLAPEHDPALAEFVSPLVHSLCSGAAGAGAAAAAAAAAVGGKRRADEDAVQPDVRHGGDAPPSASDEAAVHPPKRRETEAAAATAAALPAVPPASAEARDSGDPHE